VSLNFGCPIITQSTVGKQVLYIYEGYVLQKLKKLARSCVLLSTGNEGVGKCGYIWHNLCVEKASPPLVWALYMELHKICRLRKALWQLHQPGGLKIIGFWALKARDYFALECFEGYRRITCMYPIIFMSFKYLNLFAGIWVIR
jgi:hypothetical protein